METFWRAPPSKASSAPVTLSVVPYKALNAQVVVSKVTKQGMVGAKWGPVGQVVYLGQGKV